MDGSLNSFDIWKTLFLIFSISVHLRSQVLKIYPAKALEGLIATRKLTWLLQLSKQLVGSWKIDIPSPLTWWHASTALIYGQITSQERSFTSSTCSATVTGITHEIIYWNPITCLFSPQITTCLVDQVNANHDQEIIATRDNIEELWDSSLNLRERKKVAVRTTPGFSMGGDNVGMLR